MENLIQLQKGSKAYGSKTLFDEASFSIDTGEHIGVIGPNGAGKTTLFQILIGAEHLDDGEVIRSRKLRLGYLSQHDDWDRDETVESLVTRHAAFPIWELKRLGVDLGLTEEIFRAPLLSLSGGYRMRAKLLRMLGQDPNLMLLDEPTNYLDLETVLALEHFLQGYTGAFCLISHDREFLRRTTDHILEVESGDITKFNGNIDDYFEQKEMLRTQLTARALSLQEKRRQVLEFVARFGAKASKASQAQSRLKSLDRMEKIELKPLPVSARIRIPPPARTGKKVVTLEGVSLGYDSRMILQGVHLQIVRGDHIAVVGFNGAGKSTMLKGLAGALPSRKGTIDFGLDVVPAFFNQYVAEELDSEHTVLESLKSKAHPDIRPQEILDLAGSLLFSGQDVYKPIRVLSGGERSRVALGQVLLQRATCLVLDEPTNHLDFQTVEALTQALVQFEGAIVVVSHDRGFVRRIGTKLVEIAGGKARTYPGTYDEYVWSVEKGMFAEGRPAESTKAEAPRQSGVIPKAQPQRNDRHLRKLETEIQAMERKIRTHQDEMQSLNARIATAGGSPTADELKALVDLHNRIETLEEEWIRAQSERDSLLEV